MLVALIWNFENEVVMFLLLAHSHTHTHLSAAYLAVEKTKKHKISFKLRKRRRFALQEEKKFHSRRVLKKETSIDGY
jgi:hypothetical protein